ncbi:MAG: ABC transporter substrate-binding protein [Desulfobulbaceae bacterium]|nr:ABC transporter substrate-binding protein [Desulfobulbaceae bacterium]
MLYRIFTLLALVVVIHAFLFNRTPAVAAETPNDPIEQLRPYVDEIVEILTNERFQGDEKCMERRQKIMALAHERFDFSEMSKRVLGSQWRQLSPQEKQEFTDLFTTLLEHAYIGKIEDYTNQRVEFRDQRIRNDRAEVKTVIIDRDVVIPVSYIMILKDRHWLVYDVVVENVSLVRNYMEQFREILRKDSYSSLLAQLKDKVDRLEQETKACPVEPELESS